MNVVLPFGIGYRQFDVSSFSELAESIVEEINDTRVEYPGWLEKEEEAGNDPIKEITSMFIIDGVPASQIPEVIELVKERRNQ